MSNALAIQAVTATVHDLLFRRISDEVPGAKVSTSPPDKARDGVLEPQLNLFLYHAAIDAAWRNMDMPGVVKPGESGHPPLPLNLHYLITAYGQGDDDSVGHLLLGAAMRALHDHPVLGPRELRLALPASDLHRQVERIRITNQALTLDEMSKLWTTFQTQYRVSTAYQISVVLIESRRPMRTPLPVATRGPDDTGPIAIPEVVAPVPALREVEPRFVLSDGQIVLAGHHLDGGDVRVRFTPRPPALPMFVGPPVAGDAHGLQTALPAGLPAGPLSVAALVALPGGEETTDELELILAPRITSALPLNGARDPTGRVSLSIQVAPEIAANQAAFLLVSDRLVPAVSFTPPTSALSFSFQIAPGTYPIRLRVGETESLLIDRSAVPARYDPQQRLVVT